MVIARPVLCCFSSQFGFRIGFNPSRKLRSRGLCKAMCLGRGGKFRDIPLGANCRYKAQEVGIGLLL